MDWQDVLSFIIFLLLVLFSKKGRPTEEGETPSDEEPSFSEIDTVRKKIEALKRQRSGVPEKKVAAHPEPIKERLIFSAYKHLPKEEPAESIVIPEVVPVVPVEEKPKDIPKSIDFPREKSRLRDWVMGQVILGVPAYRRYGNFIHR